MLHSAAKQKMGIGRTSPRAVGKLLGSLAQSPTIGLKRLARIGLNSISGLLRLVAGALFRVHRPKCLSAALRVRASRSGGARFFAMDIGFSVRSGLAKGVDGQRNFKRRGPVD